MSKMPGSIVLSPTHKPVEIVYLKRKHGVDGAVVVRVGTGWRAERLKWVPLSLLTEVENA